MSEASRSYWMSVGTAGVALLGVTGYLYKQAFPTPPAQYVPLEDQSHEIEPGVRVSQCARDGEMAKFVFSDARTTATAFARGIRESNNGPCLGTRRGGNGPYEWVSYQGVYDRAQATGSGLITRGLKPQNDTFVGIYASNSIEWVVSEQACAMYSMVVVPLYDTLGADACGFIINHTTMSTVLCDKIGKAKMLIDNVKKTPSLKNIVVYEAIKDEDKESAKQNGVDLYSLSEIEVFGKNNILEPVLPEPSDLVTLCYTSGTTGDPKGVMLTHENLVSNIAGIKKATRIELSPEDRHISYLPLAHMFERIAHLICFMHGCQIGFFGGNVRQLTDDIKTLRPTLFATVPRLLSRMYDKVLQGVSGSKMTSAIFWLALNRKKALLRRGIVTRSSIWDKLVFGKIQALLGGKVKYILSGSAPLSADLLDFVRCAFGCTVMEGYGQTECTAGATMNLPYETTSGHVGPPLPNSVVKLVDVPEMDYYVRDNKGEICIKGPSVMRGYYKDEAKTQETIDKDGWLHTGDVGMWLECGALRIIDRRKHIFKLAQGEYLAPEKIENIYLASKFVAQPFVDGDSLQTFPVGVIVPDRDVLMPWAKQQGISGDFKELCENQEVKKTILADLIKVGKEGKLKGFEQVKEIHLHSEPFTMENGLLTPTFKSKRPALRKFFHDIIIEMYRSANAS